MNAKGRVPAGVPRGGQFVTSTRSEADVDLAYLRALLAETPDGKGASVVSQQTVTGADLPPLVFTHPDQFDSARMAPIVNTNHTKPDGGTWLSPGTVETGSAWDQLLNSDEYSGSDVGRARRGRIHQQVRLVDDARVLRIDSREDLLVAHDAYPPGSEGSRRFGRPSVDWEAVATDFDAVWVTGAGQSANHFPSDARSDVHLYAWDIESVVVLNPDAVRVA